MTLDRGRRVTSRWAYRRWDGTQDGFEDEVDALFSELADDLLYHGDPDAALSPPAQLGLRHGPTANASRACAADGAPAPAAPGGARARRPRGAFDEIARELDAGPGRGAGRARGAGRRGPDVRRRAAPAGHRRRRGRAQHGARAAPRPGRPGARGCSSTTSSPRRPASTSRSCSSELREEVAKSWFDQMSDALTNPDPEQLERVRQMLDALNRMIEQREAGRTDRPVLRGLHGAVRRLLPRQPPGPSTSCWTVRRPDGRRPGGHWTRCPPSSGPSSRHWPSPCSKTSTSVGRWTGWPRICSRPCPAPVGARRYRFSGSDPMGLADAAASPGSLGEMDQLEQFLRSASSPGALAEVDLDQVAKYLGDDAARSLECLARLAKQLEEAGLINQQRGPLRADRSGHPEDRPEGPVGAVLEAGQGSPRRPPEHLRGHGPRARGPDQALRVRRSLHPRHRADGSQRRYAVPARHAGAPRPDDFEIERTETLDPGVDRADARPLPLDADARQLPGRQEGGDRACTR